MKTKKRFLSILLSLALVLGLMPGMTMTALADGDTSTYTLTIPSTLTVADKGWNATDGISATGTLASGKKLTVTASSANSWALKSGDNSVGYKLATGSTDTEATTSWEFTSLSNEATNKPMGIIVEDYSSKPAGTYQDVVTFTASVGSASVPVTAITLNKTATTITKISGTATETLSVTAVTPDEATDKTYTWSSDNETVATVDASTGVVTAVATGTAHIRATANDGSGVYGECTVTVSDLSAYYSKMTSCGSSERDQIDKLKELGRGYTSYNSSLTAAQAWELAKYRATVDGKTTYVVMSSQNSGYDIHCAVSTDASATEHTYGLYALTPSVPNMYYIAQ